MKSREEASQQAKAKNKAFTVSHETTMNTFACHSAASAIQYLAENHAKALEAPDFKPLEQVKAELLEPDFLTRK